MINCDRKKWAPSEAWNMFIMFLSAYVIFALLFTYTRPENPELTKYLRYGDTLACVFFLIDVFRRFMASNDRVKFWKYGWIDVVSSIPNIAPVRFARLFYILQMIRVIRAMRAAMRISAYLFENKLKNIFAFIVSLMFTCVTICGALVLYFEQDAPNANIKDAEDALWWTVNTVTTVGSGNVYPVTIEGQLVGMVLMFLGIGMFTSTSALISAWLLGGAFYLNPQKQYRNPQEPQNRRTNNRRHKNNRNLPKEKKLDI